MYGKQTLNSSEWETADTSWVSKASRCLIDDKLSFDDHVNELCKRLSQWIAILKKIRQFLPIEQRI